MTDEREQPDLDAEWEGLARFLAGESGPDEERLIREALATDADRAALVNALDAAVAPPVDTPLSPREVEAALASVMQRRNLPADTPPAADVVPLRPRPTAEVAQLRSRWRSAGLRAAAAVLLVAGASLVWRASQDDARAPTDGQVASAPSRSYRTVVGEVDTLKLADGSTVVLGPSSHLAVGAFDEGGRETTLEGEAYFDVVHDDARPFIVRTSGATLRDIGTSFSVRSGDGERGTRVAVTSGAVDVVATRGRAGSPTVLHAGDRAEVTGDGVRVERGVVTDAERSWTRGVLEFRDAPLETVAVELRRWYGVELVVTDSTIAGRRLTATFDRSSADDLGRVLGAVLGGAVTRSGDTLRLGAATAR